MSVAAAVMALAVTTQSPVAPSAAPPPAGDALQISGDRLAYETEPGVATVRGHAELHKGPIVLRADQLTYDERRQVAHALGHVLLFQGLFAAAADELTVDLSAPEQFEASGKHLVGWQKRDTTPERLAQARSVDDIRRMGQSMLTLSGTHLKRVGPDDYVIDDLAFTPCDCSTTDPSWQIKSPRGDVQMGERAILDLPVIYVGRIPVDDRHLLWQGIPVLPLPWLYLPASDRRSGLLVPRPMYTATSGWSIDQPIFWALGRSYDLTLTPGYYFGNQPSAEVMMANESAGTPPPQFGVKGPRLVSELNYAPSERTTGRITFGLIDDLNLPRDPVDLNVIPASGERGVRGETSVHHIQDLGGGYYDRVDAALVSDGYYMRDLTTDILASTNQYLRSTAVVYHRDDNSYLGLDATVRQDLRWGYSLFGDQRDALGVAGPKTLDRLPALSYSIPDRPLLGPVSGGLQLQYTRLAPLQGLTGDEGAYGYYQPCPVGTDSNPSNCLSMPGEGDRSFELGEREARNRLDVRPELRASLPVGRFLHLVPYLSYREDVYVGEITGNVAQRGYGLGGLIAETQLSRVFDAGGGTALRHAITPNVEIRGVPRVFGDVLGPVQGGYAYDEIDAAIPGAALNPLALRMMQVGSPTSALLVPTTLPPGTGLRSLLQAVVDVRQTLDVKRKGSVQQVLLLDLGQDFDLLENRAADAFGRLVGTLGPFTTTTVLRFDVGARQLDQLSTEAMLDDKRGNAVYARFDRLLQGGSDPLRAGIDTLVGEPYVCTPQDQLALLAAGTPSATCPSFAEQLTAGVRFKLPVGLGARYEALVQPLAQPINVATSTELTRVLAKVPQQTAGISYGPACDCWRFEVHAAFFPSSAPSVGASLTISHFGTFGN